MSLTIKTEGNHRGKIDTSATTIIYDYKGFQTEFNIGCFAKKSNEAKLSDPNILLFLNQFIEYKGIDGDLNRIYSTAKGKLSVDSIDLSNKETAQDVRSMVRGFCEEVLDLVVDTEVRDFLESIGVRTPSKTPESFKDSDAKDGIISKDKTYLKHEYLGLMSISICIKAVMPIIGEAYFSRQWCFLTKNETLSFLNLISNHKFMHGEYMNRLIRYIHAHVKGNRGSTEYKIAVIRSGVPEEAFEELLLANSLFKKLTMVPLVTEPPVKGNLASIVFSVVDNAMRQQTSPSNRVSIKSSTRPGEDEESGSVLEGYVQSTTISLGDLAELNLGTSDIKRIFHQMGGRDMDLLEEFIKHTKSVYIKFRPISKGAVLLASYCIHKNIIDARAIIHIDYENTWNCIIASSAYLYENGYKEIAVLMLTEPYYGTEFEPDLNFTNITDTLKQDIDNQYLKRITKAKRSKMLTHEDDKNKTSIILSIINGFDKEFTDNTYTYLLPKEYIPEIMINESNLMKLPLNFKNLFTEVLIFINRDKKEEV